MELKTEGIIYALNPDAIQINDIVLTSNDEVIAFGIRTFTDSDFSHAAICTKKGMLIEAVPGGVMRRSVIGTFSYRREWLAVLRPKQLLGANKDGLSVADYAEALYGQDYSIRGAVASCVPILGGGEAGSVFCSQAVAQAFEDYGVTLLPGKTSSEIYPELLLGSLELENVSDSSIRKIYSQKDQALFQQIIQAAENDLPGSEMAMNRRVFTAIKKELGLDLPSHVYSLPDISSWLSQEFASEVVKRSDVKILAIMEREGFFTWYESIGTRMLADCAALESATEMAESSTDKPMSPDIASLVRDLTETLPMATSSLEARKSTALSTQQMAEKTGLKTFEKLSQLYHTQYIDADKMFSVRNKLTSALQKRKP